MLQFVNSFACTLTSKGNLVMIDCRQRAPILSKSDGEVPQTVMNDVVSLVMDADSAKGLARIIDELFDQKDLDSPS